jgi:hypothetical protein
MVNPCTCVVPQEILRNGHAWADVVDETTSTCGVRGSYLIKLEYSGDGLGPIAGDFDEVVVRDSGDVMRGNEVGRYRLSDVHTGIGSKTEGEA